MRFALLTVSSGTLTNRGTLNVNPSVSGGGRFLCGNISTSGSVNINEPTNYDQTGAAFTNTGTVTVAANKSLSTTNNPIFNQIGGSLAANGTFFQQSGTSIRRRLDRWHRLDNFTTNNLPPLGPGLTWQRTLTATFLELKVVVGQAPAGLAPAIATNPAGNGPNAATQRKRFEQRR